jgi:hypothetical protein
MSTTFLLIYLATYPTLGSLVGPFPHDSEAYCEKLATQILTGKTPILAKCVHIDQLHELKEQK